MNTSRTIISACEQCRDRRRKCDRGRPLCSPCAQRNLQCTYRQRASDAPPSPLVQELISIRERLDHITAVVDTVRPSNRFIPESYTRTPLRACGITDINLKSPILMQMVGLSPDLSSRLYQMEECSESPPETGGDYMPLDIPETTSTLILRIFHDRVHIWYPALHATFTDKFREAIARGFTPSSTDSCLSLLVVSIGFLLLDRPPRGAPHHLKAALSMLPTVLQEDSVTSVQCLVLFSIYYSCLARPRQTHTYSRLASLRIRTLMRIQSAEKDQNEWRLIHQLYWVIFLIQSEIRAHFPLSPEERRPNLPPPLPACEEYIWTFPAEASRYSGLRLSPTEVFRYFRQEVELQKIMDNHANAVSIDGHLCVPSADYRLDLLRWCKWWPNAPRCDFAPNPSDTTTPSERLIFIKAKYYAHEMSLYFPPVARIMTTGRADPELLPYCPLFFESMTEFLAASSACIRPLSPKSWPLCASMFSVALIALRATETSCLKVLVRPTLLSSLVGTLERFKLVKSTSPSLAYMWQILNERLQKATGP
ncbi:hypothetical protein BDV23DRAFT_166884 [Aspergillus alliaceus]|uniref:Zn(2)-C6 fungal-type domain-containing protein n=1 Tax=Petromyces alliaceus TaxID=209559 RepID=A0A5N7BRD3_PETAA|nr:hypothetical protein BDV23DRAFT_166884 [Aspergillus alliaceus]